MIINEIKKSVDKLIKNLYSLQYPKEKSGEHEKILVDMVMFCDLFFCSGKS